MSDQTAVLATLTTELAGLREIAEHTCSVVQVLEERLGSEVFSTDEAVLDARMTLACMGAYLALIQARIVAHESVQTAVATMGATLQAAHREIYGCDPPSDYIPPIPIPN